MLGASARRGALALLLLPGLAAASDLGALKKLEKPGGLSFAGLGVSLGAGLPVTAGVTFDRETALENRKIFILRGSSPEDLDAVRMAAGVVILSGGLLGAGAVTARQQGVAALLLRQARWKKEGPALVFDAPVYGEPSKVSGFPIQMVAKTIPVELREGDVVTLDPIAGRLRFHPREEHTVREAVANAAAAFDGLKNTQALLQWFDGQASGSLPTQKLGLMLLKELAPRVGGAAGAKDYRLLRRRVVKRLSKGSRSELVSQEADQFNAAAARTRRRLSISRAALKEVTSAKAAARLRKEAQSRQERLRALAKALGRGIRKSDSASYASFDRRALRRVKKFAAKKPQEPGEALAQAAARVGARVPQRRPLPKSAYRDFVSVNHIAGRIKDLRGDASLGLRRKSKRIVTLISKAGLTPESPLGLALLRAVPGKGEWAVVGGEDTRPLGAAAGLEPVVRFWAGLFRRGPLGKRLREGRSLDDEDTLVILERLEKAETEGAVLTRDPVSGSRERMSVTAVCRGGSREPDRYAVNRSGREVLPVILGGGRTRCLDAAALEKISLAAAAMENQFGEGLEMRFSSTKKGLLIRWVRPLARPAVNRLFALPRL